MAQLDNKVGFNLLKIGVKRYLLFMHVKWFYFFKLTFYVGSLSDQ